MISEQSDYSSLRILINTIVNQPDTTDSKNPCTRYYHHMSSKKRRWDVIEKPRINVKDTYKRRRRPTGAAVHEARVPTAGRPHYVTAAKSNSGGGEDDAGS